MAQEKKLDAEGRPLVYDAVEVRSTSDLLCRKCAKIREDSDKATHDDLVEMPYVQSGKEKQSCADCGKTLEEGMAEGLAQTIGGEPRYRFKPLT